MLAILVHGIPDTYRVWDGVRQRLRHKDTLALALPGFDSPLPEGFVSSKEHYVAWIIAQLERLGTPVDLVGHDWGCLFVARVVSLRPDLVRTWAGGGGPVSSSYEWHPYARLWQTPGAGENWMSSLDPGQLAASVHEAGVPMELAARSVGYIGAAMKDCILRLYRSAVHVGAQWQPGLANVTTPGLVFWGKHDRACPVRFAHELAANTRARRVLELDSNHWTLIERPQEVAQALEEHWDAALR